MGEFRECGHKFFVSVRNMGHHGGEDVCRGLSSLVDVKKAVSPVVDRVLAGLWRFLWIVSVGVLALTIRLGDQFTVWTLDNYFGEEATRSRHVHLFWAP
jgi:hypothetical protein